MIIAPGHRYLPCPPLYNHEREGKESNNLALLQGPAPRHGVLREGDGLQDRENQPRGSRGTETESHTRGSHELDQATRPRKRRTQNPTKPA